MALAFADILQQSRKAVRSNPDWLGSEAHRALLGDALAAAFGLADASLEWAPPGEAGYWEAATQRIALERPTLASGLPAEDLAELTALSLLHESLHAHYSTPSGSYTTRLQAVPGQVRRATDRLFNVLEDGRIAAVGAAADPTLDAPLRGFRAIRMRSASARHSRSAGSYSRKRSSTGRDLSSPCCPRPPTNRTIPGRQFVGAHCSSRRSVGSSTPTTSSPRSAQWTRCTAFGSATPARRSVGRRPWGAPAGAGKSEPDEPSRHLDAVLRA